MAHSSGGQPLRIRSANAYPYTTTLAAIYRSGLWIPDQDWALAQDANVWETVQLDPIVRQAISTRLHKVAGRASRLEAGRDDPASKRLADICTDMLEGITNLAQAKLNLAKAVLLGRTYGWIKAREVRTSLGGIDEPVMPWWLPFEIQDVARQRIRFVAKTEPKEDASGLTVVAPPDVEISDLQIAKWSVIPPWKWENFVRLVYDDDEARLGYGRGILQSIYYYHYAKGIVLREGLQLVERWSQGLVVGSIDLDREGSVGKTNEDAKSALLNSIQKMRAANALVVGKGEEIDVKWPSGEGSSVIMAMLEYLDNGIVRAVHGAPLSLGSGEDVGSNARSESENDSTEDVLAYDATQLDNALSRDLIGQFIKNNRETLRAIGLGGARPPKFVPHRETRMEPEEASRVIKTFLDAGIPVAKREAYELCGLSVPAPSEEVIEPRPAPSPFGGLGMGGIGGGLPGLGGDPFGDEERPEPSMGGKRPGALAPKRPEPKVA